MQTRVVYGVMANTGAFMVPTADKVLAWSMIIRVLDDKGLLLITARLPVFAPPA